jgi:hypothetical protein
MADRTPTAWAVRCPTHGLVYMARRTYSKQLKDNPNYRFTCIVRGCGQPAEFDEDNYDHLITTMPRPKASSPKRTAAKREAKARSHKAATPRTKPVPPRRWQYFLNDELAFIRRAVAAIPHDETDSWEPEDVKMLQESICGTIDTELLHRSLTRKQAESQVVGGDD